MAKRKLTEPAKILCRTALTATLFLLWLACGAYLICTERIGEEAASVIVGSGAVLSAFLPAALKGQGGWKKPLIAPVAFWAVLTSTGTAVFRHCDLRAALLLLMLFLLGAMAGTWCFAHIGKKVNKRKKHRKRK